VIETVPELLRTAARRWGGRTALKAMDEPATSFATLDAQADRFAKALIADGMAAGERLAIWAPNMAEWVAAAVGAQRAAATIVPLNLRLRVAEIADILQRARVTRVVCIGQHRGESYPPMLRGLELPDLVRVVVLRPDGAMPAGLEVAWDRFLAAGDAVSGERLAERERGVTGETISDILFTSGTTGRPKGAVFRHASTVRSGFGMVNFARVTDSDCLCPLGPFAHFAGYKGGWVNGLVTGATVCWSEAHDGDSIIAAIEGMKITVMPAPPVVWRDVLDHPRRGERDLSSLRFIATGSTTIPPSLVRRLIAELNVEQVGTGYGLTESGGMTNFARRDDPVARVVETAGRPAPDAEVRIAGPDGEECAPGQPGEILVRTRRALREYLDDAEATRAALDPDGWLHTGDVGHVDDEGYLTVTDRLKDMYITNGYNVYPAELEKLMAAIPGIAQCAVVGLPDARKGEIGHAFVVREQRSAVGETEILAWCRENIAGYKVPAGISFVEEFPRNSQGKVLKRELKAGV
jgi:acyl-CoA synthetase (AMP-forming)/AMP-acid ligase II